MRLFFTTVLIFFLRSLSYAQDFPMVNQYMFNQLYFNPGVAGLNEELSASFLHRQQWVNFKGAPFSDIFTIDAPFKNDKIGLGAVLSNDRTGVTNQSDLNFSFSYHLKVSDEAKLGMGLRGGLSFYSVGNRDLVYWDQDDYVLNENTRSALLPRMGFGLFLMNTNYYVGLSAPDLFTYDSKNVFINHNNGNKNLMRNYFLTAGYEAYLSGNIEFKPSVLIKYYPISSMLADLNANFIFNEKLLLGAGYRTNKALIGMAHLGISDKIKIGYSFEYKIAKNSIPSYGSHEIMITYGFLY